VERRRRWRAEDKLRVLAEAAQPGARTSEVARRHDISRGLLWSWRRQLRQGRLAVIWSPAVSNRALMESYSLGRCCDNQRRRVA
jgi:hypothetical protein